MKKTAFLLSLLVAVPHLFAAETYKTDPAHTDIEFKVPYMLMTTVSGRFDSYEGTLVWDEKNPKNSSLQVTIQAGSINTNNEKRDGHLKSPDFFNVEKYPTITFKSEKIKKEGDGYVAIGTLTMHGVSKEFKIPFTVTDKVTGMYGNTRRGVSAEFTVDRTDFDISWNKTLDKGGLLVGKEVTVIVSAQGVLEK